MQELVLASNNGGKIREIKALLPGINLVSLAEIGFTQEIPEPFHTFEENALAKASAIYRFQHCNVLADDSGLCVDSLNGAPGVISAHYSGSRNDEANLQLVLQQLEGHADRRAHYKAVICLIWEGSTHYFEGKCEGRIAAAPMGTDGFGYDPIFVPDGHQQSFGQLPLPIKNQISHRGKALEKMVAFLAAQTMGHMP